MKKKIILLALIILSFGLFTKNPSAVSYSSAKCAYSIDIKDTCNIVINYSEDGNISASLLGGKDAKYNENIVDSRKQKECNNRSVSISNPIKSNHNAWVDKSTGNLIQSSDDCPKSIWCKYSNNKYTCYKTKDHSGVEEYTSNSNSGYGCSFKKGDAYKVNGKIKKSDATICEYAQVGGRDQCQSYDQTSGAAEYCITAEATVTIYNGKMTATVKGNPTYGTNSYAGKYTANDATIKKYAKGKTCPKQFCFNSSSKIFSYTKKDYSTCFDDRESAINEKKNQGYDKPGDSSNDDDSHYDEDDRTPDDINWDDAEGCDMFGQLLVIIKEIFNTIKWVISFGLVLLTMFDFLKAVVSGDDDTTKKAFNKFVKRIMIVILIFLLPELIDFIISAFKLNVESCVNGFK